FVFEFCSYLNSPIQIIINILYFILEYDIISCVLIIPMNGSFGKKTIFISGKSEKQQKSFSFYHIFLFYKI
ncbi:MAG: hypothetical protein ACI4SF_06525, partial [Oscillospiraceae bacterium]